jgi:hypothetical protein
MRWVFKIISIPVSSWLYDEVVVGYDEWKDVFPTIMKIQNSSSCLFLEKTMQLIIEFKVLRNITHVTELSMPSFVEDFLFLWLVIFRTGYSRVTHTSVTGSKRPDFISSPFGAPLIVGEDKVRNNYSPGQYGKDPELENQEKMTFELWGEFYGEIPFVFAYAAIADNNQYEFILGAVVRNSQQFERIETYDLTVIADRVQLVKDMLTLAPLFRAVGLRQRETKRNIKFHTEQNAIAGMTSGVISWEVDISVEHNTPLVKKTWRFTTPDNATMFFARMRAVFDTLATIPNHQQKFIYLHGNILKIVENTIVSAVFRPWGIPFDAMNVNVDEFVGGLLQIAQTIRDLQAVHIIHNDIRWENIIVVREQQHSHFMLIDFDDAVQVTDDNPITIGCPWMNQLTHSPNIHQPHSYEVDVWSIHRLILGKIGQLHDHNKITALNTLANSIHMEFINAANHQNLTADFARDEIERIIHALTNIRNQP